MEHQAQSPVSAPGAGALENEGSSATNPWHDVVGVAFTVVCAVLVLLPVLRPGVTLGPFDLLTRFGLTRQPGVTVHNAIQADQIQQFVPWTDLVWHQVHNGQLPLWNPYSGLGTPLAFNWQSGVFSLPMLVAYLVPVRSAYAVVVLMKLVIAGTGGYTLCRALKLGPLSATFGGVAFELSGPIIVHSGWAMTGVTCWTGWILAAVVLLLGGRHRLRHGALLAVTVAFAVYGGHPESLIIVLLSCAGFVVVYFALVRHSKGIMSWRRLLDIAVAGVCGFGLSAPLLFPGVQLGLSSARKVSTGAPAFSLTHIPNVLTGGLQGSDFTNSAYVGVIVLTLAAVGTKLYWRRPEIPALVAVAAGCTLLTFFSPADTLLHLLPLGHTIAWSRSVMVLPLALAVLAAFGAEAVVSSTERQTIVLWAAWALGGAAVLVVAVVAGAVLGLTPVASHQLGSLIGPGVELVVAVAAVAALKWTGVVDRHLAVGTERLRRYVVVALVGVNAGFLILSGVSFWSESSTYFSPTPAVSALRQTVGTSLVGFGSCKHLSYLTPSIQEVGIRPEDNIGFGIHEMAVYDPIIPDSYFRSWKAISGLSSTPALTGLGIFCARITTASEARILGVRYVLEAPGKAGPTGSTFTRTIGDEALYSISDSGEATLSRAPTATTALPIDASARTVPVTHPSTTSWRVVTDATEPQILRLRLTNVPGWNATIDGRPLTLHPWAHGLMLEAHIPAGPHGIELSYWPAAFTDGLAVAGAVAYGFVLTSLIVGLRAAGRRRRARAKT